MMLVIVGVIYWFTFVFKIGDAELLCPAQCECRSETPLCAPGVSLVLDGCGCCRVCAQQAGQGCDEAARVCDPHRNIFCDYSRSASGDVGVCKAQTGRGCWHEGALVASGGMFQPSCKKRCWCMDGNIGCIPLCPHETAPPTNCPTVARLVRTPECCDEWRCDTGAATLDLSDFVGTDADNDPYPIAPEYDYDDDVANTIGTDGAIYSDGGADGDELLDYQLVYADWAAAPRGTAPSDADDDTWTATNDFPEATTTIVRPPPPAVPGSSCPHQQTSAWSPCSKTCGLGVSTRVSNLNSDCRLMRDVRLCFLRPCTAAKLAPKYGRRCMRQKRSDTKSRFAYAGCTSVRAFKLRYCGVCKEENRCCTPRQTRTSRIRFRCPDAGGRVFFKKVMVIKSCHCHRNCAAHVPTNRIPDTM